MEIIIDYHYDLSYNKQDIKNQIILWKVENYNSYLTNFSISDDEKMVTFTTLLNGDIVVFNYFVYEEIINVENLKDELFLQNILSLNNVGNMNLYSVLSNLEDFIENMPDEDLDDEEIIEEEVIEVEEIIEEENETQMYFYESQSQVNSVKISELVTDLNKKLGISDISNLTIYETLDDNKSETNEIIKVNCKLLSEISDSETNINMSDSITSCEITDEYYNEYIKNLSEDYSNITTIPEIINQDNINNIIIEETLDLTDIIIQSLKSESEEQLEMVEDDPYNLLILSDSDFNTFYENLDVSKDHEILNERDILNISKKIFNDESPIVDEEMKKYAFNDVSIIKMIIKEITKANLLEGIKIVPENNNIFRLNVTIDKFLDGRILEEFIKYKEINPDFDSKLHLTIDMPKQYYPYAPPTINIIEPKFSDAFLFSITSLEYFKQENWNPSNKIEHTLNGLIQIISNYGSIVPDDFNSKLNINKNIVELWSLLSLESPVNDVKIEFIKLTGINGEIKTTTTKMASGTGYSNGSSKSWDVKKFLSEKKNKSRDIISNLKEINIKLSECDLLSEEFTQNKSEFIQNKLGPILDFYLYDVNILEITNKLQEYVQVIMMLTYLQPYYDQITYKNRKLSLLINNLITTVKDYNEMTNASINKKPDIRKSIVDVPVVTHIISANIIKKKKVIDNKKLNNEEDGNDEEILSNLCDKIIKLNVEIIHNVNVNLDKRNYDSLKELQFDSANFTAFSIKETNIPGPNISKKILREFSALKKNLPFNYDSSIYFRYDEKSMDKIKFLIVGPKDTPYQDGCFVFDMKLPSTYPSTHPNVNFLTTGKASVRFNPNLYNCGKVCLSLLGTWQGESWNEDSTMLQLLVSIQSLILIDHPYFNEPGYQASFGTPSGMIESEKYNKKIRAANIKWGIIDSIINPHPEFADIIKNHFSIKKDEIIRLANQWSNGNLEVTNQIPALKKAFSEI